MTVFVYNCSVSYSDELLENFLGCFSVFFPLDFGLFEFIRLEKEMQVGNYAKPMKP